MYIKTTTTLIILILLALFVGAMGGAGASASATEYEYDIYSPYLFNAVPSGNVIGTSTVIGAGIHDFSFSSGFDSGATIVLLDGLPVAGCTTSWIFGTSWNNDPSFRDASGNVSCPVSGLSPGAHYYQIQVADMAGNQSLITGNFTVSPSCEERTPLSVTTGLNEGPGTTFTVRVELDRSFADPIIFWDGGDPPAYNWQWDEGSDMAGTATVTVPASATPGTHQITVWSVDTEYGSFCQLEVTQDYIVAYDLPLSVGVAKSYWGSYADYLSRELSVDYRIYNRGVNDAFNVSITESINTNGVIAINLPATVGDVPAGSTGIGMVRYSISPGTGSFRATLAATAEDAIGYPHAYP